MNDTRLLSRLTGPVLKLCLALGLLAATVAPVSAQDDARTQAVKRLYFIEVNAKCGLFSPKTTLALKGGYIQARNAALRQGAGWTRLSPWLEEARAAAERTSCDSAQMRTEAATVQRSAATYAGRPRQVFDSGRSSWSADRGYPEEIKWRLVQYQASPDARLAIGLYGALGAPSFSVMAEFADGVRPYSARLVVRDAVRQRTPVIDYTAYGLSRAQPLGVNPQWGQSFMASDMSSLLIALTPQVTANEAGIGLTGQHVGISKPTEARRFDFPTRAWSAIARLDPREDILIVFDCPDGPRYARFEVGDFVPALIFTTMP